MDRLRSPITKRIAIAAAFVLAVAGGGVVASTTNSAITVCVNKQTGVIRRESSSRRCDRRTEDRLVINQQGPKGDKGDTGPAGATGAAGVGGVPLTFSTTVTDADPGQGGLRYNSATIASVTSLLVDLTDANGEVIMNFLDQFGVSTNTPQRGYIYLRSVSGSALNIFSVTGHAVDATGYRRIPVAYVSGSLPANNEAMVLTFSATGNVGPAGPAGADAKITERSVCGAGGNELCKIGMTGPGGGIVFFIDYMDQYPSFCADGVSHCNYLEASPADAAVTVDSQTTNYRWCSNTTGLLGLDAWDKSAVGAGRTNTAFMLAGTPARCTSGAAVVANTYAAAGGAGAGSWWLPSIGELMEMYWNLRTAGVGGFALERYWSSSERNATNAWGQNFFGGAQGSYPKTDDIRVRPVRGF